MNAYLKKLRTIVTKAKAIARANEADYQTTKKIYNAINYAHTAAANRANETAYQAYIATLQYENAKAKAKIKASL